MSGMKIFDISGAALVAQSVRLNTVASNLANADSVGASREAVFKAKHPVFVADGDSVRVDGVVESTRPPLARYEPGNPSADAAGYVYTPDIDPVEQMVDMISASRSYQSNLEVMNASKEMLLSTLRVGQ